MPTAAPEKRPEPHLEEAVYLRDMLSSPMPFRRRVPSIPCGVLAAAAGLALLLTILQPGAAAGAVGEQVPGEERLPPDTLPVPGAPDEGCEKGRISNIFVDNHSIFDVDDLPDEGRLRWAYELANTVHVRTRASLVARELLFEVGDCLDSDVLDESARILREFRFIARADVFSVPHPDGSYHVVVDTRDEWTTKMTVAMEVDGGVRFYGGSLAEENFLGRGVLVGVFYEEREEMRDLGATLEVPRILRTRLDGRLLLGRTREGRNVEQAIVVPFVGEVSQLAGRQVFQRRDDLFTYAVGEDRPLTHVLLPLTVETAEVAAAARLGRPGRLTLLGLGLSRERVLPDAGGGGVDGIVDGDFGDRVPVDDATVAELGDQRLPREATRISVLLGQRNLRFVERRGLDPLRGIQDVPVGGEVTVSLGRSIGFLESSSAEAPDDLFGRLTAAAGAAPFPWVLQGHLSLEGRHVRSGSPSGPGWRDVLSEARLLAYRRGEDDSIHTFVAQLSASGGWSVDTPYQLTLGGADGVRGLPDYAYPSGRNAVLSVEDRITLPGPLRELADLGVTVFGDMGRAWAGRVPFGESSGWRGSLGAGLRIGFPAGTAGVIRADLAFPMGAGGRGPILRISAREVVGMMASPGSQQLDRSRRAGIDTRFVGVAR